MEARELVQRAAGLGHVVTVREHGKSGYQRFYGFCTCGETGPNAVNATIALRRVLHHLENEVGRPRRSIPPGQRRG